MVKLLSILLTIMTFFGGWFGFADKIDANPAKISFSSPELASEADISVSSSEYLKWTLTDSASLTYWTTGKNNGEYIEINFGSPAEINTLVLRELTDNVRLFTVYAETENGYTEIYRQDRIMTYRLCSFDAVTTEKIKIEFTDISAPVKIGGVEVYNESRSNPDFRVSEYLVFNEYTGDFMAKPGFSDYFNVVTDIIVISTVSLNKNGDIVISIGEDKFSEYLDTLKDAVKGRDVTLWCTVLFQLESDDPNEDPNDYRCDFLNNNFDKIMSGIKEFCEKYGFDGIDYDWEHPTKSYQFDAYNKLILKTAEFAKVSIACTIWQFGFSDEAIEAVDHFNVMSYDLFDDRGDHSDIYECGRLAIEKMIGFGVPKEKIFLGIPEYGRPENGDPFWPAFSDYPDLGKFGNYVSDVTYEADGSEKTAGIYFNSHAEARDKTALSLQFGCGGIMLFNMNSDLPFENENSIHKAVFNAIENN